MKACRLLALLGTCVAAGSPASSGQTRVTGADVRGTVQDMSGGRLPGVTVSATSLATNIVRDAVSDAEGRYAISALEPGTYDISAHLDGFVVAPRRAVALQIGDVVDLPFEMRPAAIAVTVLVPGSEPAVVPARTLISTVVAQREIDALPLNGRRFIDLAALAAGVTSGGPADPTAETSGLSFVGQRPVSNSLLVDGLDNNDRVLGGATANFTQESIREFRVLTASYPAEFGGATGGIVNVVTRSGTNTLHGGAFLFYRDRALNARGYFERADPVGGPIDVPKAPFRQGQFGGTLGGPIRADRTFFFAALERTETRTANVVTIDPAIAAVLGSAGFPVQTGQVPFSRHLGQILGRLDHYWRPESNLGVRVQVSDTFDENYAPFGGTVARSRGATLDRRDWGVAASQNNVIASRWVNEARVQVAHQRHEVEPHDRAGPAVTLLGVADVGRNSLYPTDRTNWTLQAKNTLTRAARRHTFKVGGDLLHVDQRALLSYTFGGSYVFVNLPPIPGLFPAGLSATQSFVAGVPALYVQGYGYGNSPFQYTETAAFVQDDWQPTDRLTLKGGLRYQRQQFPDFQVTVSDLGGTTLTYPFPLSDGHVSPRLAAAFDPAGDGRTAIHGAYGLFFGDQLTSVYGVTNVFGRDDGTRLNVFPFPASAVAWSVPGRTLPEGLLSAPSVTITVGPGAQTPRLHQASAGVARDFGGGLSAAADVVYARGLHQLGALDYNPVVPALGPGRRPNDSGGIAGTSTSAVRYVDFGETWYRGLLVSVRDVRAGHDLRLAYTWSDARDNAARFSGLVNDNGRGRNPLDPAGLPLGFDPESEKGPASTDQRHRLVFSGSYLTRGGVSIAGVLAASSGLPYTPLAGADLNGDGIPDADRARGNPLDASSVVGRNSARLPSQVTLDLRISRPIRFAGGVTLAPILDVFNLFNRDNVNEVNAVFGPGAFPSEPPRDPLGRVTYGRVQQTLAPRQLQVAARLSF